MAIEAELKRQQADGSLVSWLLNDDGTDPVADEVARALLRSLLERLAETLSVSIDGDVTLANPPADPETGLAKEQTLATRATEATLRRMSSRFWQVFYLVADDDEEFRALEDPATGDRYHGLAPDGSAESDPVWDVVRLYAPDAARGRLRRSIRWDQRTEGWS